MKKQKQMTLVAALGCSVLVLSGIAFAAQTAAQTATPTLSDGPKEKFPAKVIFPKDNASSKAKIELGKKLYFDPRLSKASKVSCNSCHNVMTTGDDGLPRSPGHEGKLGGRNSPTVFNAALLSVQFWDGRAPSLEEQAKGPIINPLEMGMASHDVVVDLISKVPAYHKEFEKAFGPGKVTIDKMVKAIASYERTLIARGSDYDRFIAGDKSALTPAAERGWRQFSAVGCTACHGGPMFNGPQMAMGTGFYQKFPLIPNAEIEAKYHFTEDTGRHTETKQDSDRHMWRVPSLRTVAYTAPYFHNGSVAKLEDAVTIMAKLQLGKDLEPAVASDIAAFLKSLAGKVEKQTSPSLPPPAGETKDVSVREAKATPAGSKESAPTPQKD